MERSITYESTEEALADIYGTSFKRVNWINKGNKYRSKFNKVSDIIAYIDDEADDTAKFISMYSNADGTILFDNTATFAPNSAINGAINLIDNQTLIIALNN